MGGHFFLSRDDPVPADNGAILVISHVIKTVMTSAAEAELGALYINAREAVYIQNILEAMGHPQPRTPVQTDNSTAEGVVNNKILPKQTKAMDIRFHGAERRRSISVSSGGQGQQTKVIIPANTILGCTTKMRDQRG